MSLKKSEIFSFLFLGVSILHIVGIIIDEKLLQVIFKPLILLTLIVLYYHTVERINKWYLIALIFSFFGDVLLMNKEKYFLFGIAAFLITQIMFVKIIVGQLKELTTRNMVYACIPFVIYLLLLVYVLSPNLGDYLIPVIIYGTVISIFGMVSLLNYLANKASKNSINLLVGAVLFILSDSMIALNKFYESHAIFPVAIMMTYILAQYLIFKFMAKTKSN